MKSLLGALQQPMLKAGLLLSVVILAINAIAIAGILAAGKNARDAAQEDLELQTTAHARSLEALLATLRSDFLFLSQAQPLLRITATNQSPDPVTRRWGRLDVEGTLLLFLQTRPAVTQVVLARNTTKAIIVAGRRQGSPQLLPASQSWPADAVHWLNATWSLNGPRGENWQLQAWVDPQKLLAIVAPGLTDRLSIVWQPAELPAGGAAELVETLAVQLAVDPVHWQTPGGFWLIRREDKSRLISSVENLARRYRTTVALNLGVMVLTLALGAAALRQVQRSARLRAEFQQQARVRQLERRLVHSERLASVGRLAAGMAHEINNPLAGMANYLALLEDDLAAGRVETAPVLVTRLREGLERAAGITRQALDLATPGGSAKVAVDVGAILARTLDFVRGNPAYQAIEFALTLPPEPLSITANPVTLGQVFLNLLLNACQSQPQGGRIEVRCERMEPDVVVTLADRGPGLPAVASEALFEPFFSTRGSTGLGLAVCRSIVLDHGGTICGRNRVGGGAQFEVRLPAPTRAAVGQPGAGVDTALTAAEPVGT